ncbi:SulP family inorganic anion transporter, partial [Persicitalea sp.]|uniref:SulP family inorganic anion transporter n=1 Tax=Persicitalea sp. TaxID=3100273 RepID=UPI003593844A
MKKYFNLFDLKQKVDYKTEILSGLTVALALVPEAVAFAFIAGLSPLTGLYAAFMMGLVTSIFGGRPGMISGATGAVAVIIVALAKSYGV